MFTAWGNPAPQGSKMPYGGGRVESSKHLKPFRDAVAMYAKLAVAKLPRDKRVKFPLEGPLVATMVFTVRRVTRGSNAADAPSVMPDLSKYCRAAEDAVKNIVWTDDGRVIGYDLLWKTYPGRHPYALERPGLVLAVRRATHAELGLSTESPQGIKYTNLMEKWNAGDRG